MGFNMPDIPTQTCIVTDGAGTISGSNVSDITVSCRNVLVSANRAGIEGSGTSWGLSVNSDGQYVAFSSSANNLVDGDINNNHDIFVKNTAYSCAYC